MALGYNATRRRWPSGGRQAAPISRCIPVLYRRQPPFIAIGDRLVAVYERDSRAIHALYNASDGAAYIKTIHSIQVADNWRCSITCFTASRW